MALAARADDTLGMRRFDELSDEERNERFLRLVEKALHGYGLTGRLSHAATATHVVLRLQVGGTSYAVRISPSGCDHALLRRELVWLAALGRDTDLRVPEPILTLSGDLFRSVSMEGVPGTRACTVQRWIEGERREAELTEAEARAIGRFAASLHRHAEGFRWPEELDLPYVSPAERAVAAADILSDLLAIVDDRALLRSAVGRIADVTNSLGEGPDAVGSIHGDLRLRKLRHEADSVGAFGFDECRKGAYLDDLSVLWAELGGRDATPALHLALLDEYRSLRDASVTGDVLDALAVLRALEETARGCGAQRTRPLSLAAAERTATFLRHYLASRA